METITQQLFELGKEFITLKPEIRDETGKYHMADDGGVETEVGELLYGLIRVLQPENILETGTYTGISSLYMAQALKDNTHGHITTLEIEETHKKRAENLWNACGVNGYVTCKLQRSLEYMPSEKYDFMFLDSEPDIRFSELVRFFDNLKRGGYVLIHDVPRNLCQGNVNPDHPELKSWPFGDVPYQIKQWVKEDRLRPIHFPTPRGLFGFYKPHEEDLQWV